MDNVHWTSSLEASCDAKKRSGVKWKKWWGRLVVGALVSGEQSVLRPHTHVTQAWLFIGEATAFPAIWLDNCQDKSVGTRKTNKLQMWSEVQSGKEHCRAESCRTKHYQTLKTILLLGTTFHHTTIFHHITLQCMYNTRMATFQKIHQIERE